MKPEDRKACEMALSEYQKLFEGKEILISHADFHHGFYRGMSHRDAQPAVAVNEQLLEALQDFSDYVHGEQSSTDGAVVYSNTQINRLVFKARAAIAAAEAAKGGV